MNLRQLEAFRATMRCGSITGAANILHISQPSVSRLIAELERSLGFTLFTRQGQGLVATIEARKFQQSVESMFVGLDKLRGVAESIRTARDETVSLGVIPAFANVVMPESVCAVRAENSELQFEISVLNTPSIVDAVLLQQLDLGVICPTGRYEGLHILHDISVPYVCLLPANHPLAREHRPIDIWQCGEEEFVTLDPDYLDQTGDDQSLLTRLRDKARIVSRSDPAIASIARVAGLLAIVDPYTANVAVALGGVVVRPIAQNLRYPVSIVARGTDTLSIAAAGLLKSLIHHFNKFEREHNKADT